MNDQVVGTCNKCGGRVCIPSAWFGIYPPVPTCIACGATKKQANGPVIEMDDPPARRPPVQWDFKPTTTSEGADHAR